MADDLLFGNIGQMSGPTRQWRNYAQGSMLQAAIGSGAVIATFSDTGGILKGVYVTTYNTPILVIRDGAGTMHSLASGALTPGWVPCWEECKDELTISKADGTAETVYLLFGTGLAPFV